jgi:glycosyltransferase involved in cell wall biosynthesis
MSVVMVTRDYRPRASGIATHTSELVKALTSFGIRVDTIAGFGDIRTLLIPALRDLDGYDIVHVQSTPYAALINHPHLVITVHAPVATELRYYPLLTRLKTPIAFLCEKISLRKARQIIAVSQKTRDDLVGRYGLAEETITTIHNAVDCEKFKPAPKHSRGTRIVMCSRLEPRKNIPEALLALASLKPLRFQCDIIGEGSQGKALMDIAQRLDLDARFVGLVSDEELSRHYGEADIFLSTSASEGFGLTVLEAMASGCAVIVSDISAHREFVRHLENGLIYRNSDELVSYLKLLMSRPDLAQQLGSEARKTSLQYSWTKVAQRVVEVYDKVLSQGAPHERP